MKSEFLLAKLDRMPMLKAVVPFAAGILAADRFALPLWFLAGAFLLSGVLALLLRSPAGCHVPSAGSRHAVTVASAEA